MRKASNLMLCDQNDNRWVFFLLEFGFVEKQKQEQGSYPA